mmetsp:Transcript_24990/g.54334  ORF Transcript_24990/g.54334 Transcript_24990/m.54334 type:complete len:169 (-) Transcript_24990:2428-2934(-)|eukprot:CAMPEP_0202920426 /NCGR_PEP_ID=MMETSP1392-20130828/76851_1 /ASSEMBLY_ACC=CAM_ASM_000868 /TAXON_ID=225041 /ORGANISM="Chlamydomonas chlamydogama, Strain SAG 11-48b" /LENGTH=168 /DNA_ID=CAMNT_0049613921 /DNA_START=103 /DNA_END=609 /DNA_ORIENTATION=+
MYRKAIAAARKDKARRQQTGVTEEQLAQFKEAFELFDADKSGCIDEKELRACMRAVGFDVSKQEVQRMIASVDDDGSGTIEFPEFMKLMCQQQERKDPKEDVKRVFMLYDTQGKGHITVDDLQRACRQLGESMSDAQLAEMLRIADVDKDGEVRPSDFYRTMRKTSLY